MNFTISAKLVLGSLSLLITAVGFVLNFGIIWYEHTVPDMYRTLVNKMSAMLSGHIILMVASWMLVVISVVVLEIHLYTFCLLSLTTSFVLSLAVLVVLDEIMVLRFFYTCIFTSVGALNEEFFKYFIGLTNLMFFCLLFFFIIVQQDKIGGRHLFCWCTCMPSDECNSDTALPLAKVLLTMTIAIYCFCLSMMILKPNHNSTGLSSNFEQFNIILTKDLLATTIALILTLLFPLIMSKMLIDIFPQFINVMTPSVLILCMAVWACAVPLRYYTKNEHLRSWVWEGLKNKIPVVKIPNWLPWPKNNQIHPTIV